MNDFMKNLLDGMGNVLEVYRGDPYVIPKKGDPYRDHQALSDDMRRVGNDMRTVLLNESDYGKTYQS